MKFRTREVIKSLEEKLKTGYALSIFKGYKAVNKNGIEKLIDEIYMQLPYDVQKARRYLETKSYELNKPAIKSSASVYEALKLLDVEIANSIRILSFVILNIRQIEEILNKIQIDMPKEIIQAESVSK